jgi:alcohol dehydrogenase class IV
LHSKVLKSLPNECERLTIGGIPEEPSYSDILESMSKINNFGPDWFIALGGKSPNIVFTTQISRRLPREFCLEYF